MSVQLHVDVTIHVYQTITSLGTEIDNVFPLINDAPYSSKMK